MKKAVAKAPKRKAAQDADAAAMIAAYFAKTPEPARKMLEEIRATVIATAPAATIEIFSYGLPGFVYKGRLLWYGAFKSHVGFFPGSPPMIKSLAEELKGYKTSKGTIQFPLERPVPKALVKKVVKLRVAENEARSK